MSAEVLEVGWLCVTLAEMTNARERVLAAACEGASLNPRDKEPFLKSRSAQLTLASSAASRRSALANVTAAQSSLRARALSLCARALSPCACSHGMHTGGMRARSMTYGMAWTQGWHGHRDGMDTSTHETRS